MNFNDVRPSISSETAEFLHEHLGVSPSFLAVMIRKSWELKSGNCQWVKAVPGDDGEDCIVGKNASQPSLVSPKHADIPTYRQRAGIGTRVD